MTLRTEYIVDKSGRKKFVVLSVCDFKKIVEYVEDMEDALDLKKAIKTSKGSIDFEEFASGLKRKAA